MCWLGGLIGVLRWSSSWLGLVLLVLVVCWCWLGCLLSVGCVSNVVLGKWVWCVLVLCWLLLVLLLWWLDWYGCCLVVLVIFCWRWLLGLLVLWLGWWLVGVDVVVGYWFWFNGNGVGWCCCVLVVGSIVWILVRLGWFLLVLCLVLCLGCWVVFIVFSLVGLVLVGWVCRVVLCRWLLGGCGVDCFVLESWYCCLVIWFVCVGVGVLVIRCWLVLVVEIVIVICFVECLWCWLLCVVMVWCWFDWLFGWGIWWIRLGIVVGCWVFRRFVWKWCCVDCGLVYLVVFGIDLGVLECWVCGLVFD